MLSQMQENGILNSFSFLKAEELREAILDCQGACERILRTPMPFVMAIKSRRFIFLFLIILPFGIVNYSVYINPIIVTLVGYALFALDQIGVELQNPFSTENLSHLPLSDICNTIEKNLMENEFNMPFSCIWDNIEASFDEIKLGLCCQSFI